MSVLTYDPASILVIIGGNPINGFADGTFVSIARATDLYTQVSSADGSLSRSKSNDRSAMLTLTLQMTSPSNDNLTSFFLADLNNNSGIFPAMVKDNNGRTLVASGACWIQQLPTIEYGKEISDRAWVIVMSDCDYFIGGND